MAAIFEDPSVFDAFEGREKFDHSKAKDVKVEVLDWSKDNDRPRSHCVPVPELATMPEPHLRIVFLPLDHPGDKGKHGLLWAFRHYSVPSAFLDERLRSVTHSFGAQSDAHGNNCVWFHHLCKSIAVGRANGESWIYEPRSQVQSLKQANWTWKKSGYFMKWCTTDLDDPRVTLLCFQASDLLLNRLRALQSVKTAMRDPIALLVIILSDISSNMDSTVWEVSDVFGKIETRALMMSQERESFTGLHNVAKHIVYLQESCDATSLIVQKVIAHSELLQGKASDGDKEIMECTRGMLTQVETSFETVNLRLRSLDRRMQSVIALSFHLVAAEGNRIMHSDSNTMTTIGLVTLIFLPLTTVSTIFGSQFFGLSDEDNALTVSQDFWMFWVISMPVTVIVLGAWYAMKWRRFEMVNRNKQIMASQHQVIEKYPGA
ncbi:hypothetical protein N7457_007206 [Penicillium paradoxum]|uniref:uncharacterized protein n=1 Tax=Penicillium paradoxum TaxID=176176 RepID=UPI002546D398|nr:uncharacterized protein N7457_007206 [Penicillium paradoxum]KAJ5779486.1 hypothetical protein N7457_007206 [Penicillium paradoxum]